MASADDLTTLYDLIDEIGTGMLTTQADDGALVSRPMQTLEHGPDGVLTFMTSSQTHKVDELRARPAVNLGYYSEKSRQWVSVSGSCSVSQDRPRIHRLYKADWKAWLQDEGPGRDGGPDDERILLLDVDVREASFFQTNAPTPVLLLKMAAGAITGKRPDLGEVRHVDAPAASAS